MNNAYTGKDWSEVEELEFSKGDTRITPLGDRKSTRLNSSHL